MPENPFSRDPAVSVAVGADTSGFTNQIDDAIGKLGGFKAAAAGTGAALGALAVGGLAAATNAAADFEEAMVEVEKVTDPETARNMSDAIREMANTIPLAQSELAGLAADAARFGIRGEENIRAFTESVARMATATNISAAQAGEDLARLAQLTNTPITEVENLGSAVNELSNNFATSADEIVDSMLRSSAALSQFGLTQTEIVGLSAALNEVSESSERAGTRLRRVAQELMEPKKVEDLAAALGLSVGEFERMRREEPARLIQDMAVAMSEGGREADALRSTLSTASRQAVAGLAQNLEGMNRALDTSASSYRDATSLQREFDAATDTFNSKLQITKNRLRNVAIETGNRTLPAMTGMLETANDLITDFQTLNTRTDGLAGTMTLATTAAVGLGGALAWLVGGPMAATALGAGLLAAAWTSNFADIQGVTGRTFAEVGDIVDRTMDAMRFKTRSSLDNQLSAWQKFETTVAAGWEWLTTKMLNYIDTVSSVGIATGDLVANTIKAMAQAAQGDTDAALKTLNQARERNLEYIQDASERNEARNERLRLLNADRRGAIATGDASLLPSHRGGESLSDVVEANEESAEAAEELSDAAGNGASMYPTTGGNPFGREGPSFPSSSGTGSGGGSTPSLFWDAEAGEIRPSSERLPEWAQRVLAADPGHSTGSGAASMVSGGSGTGVGVGASTAASTFSNAVDRFAEHVRNLHVTFDPIRVHVIPDDPRFDAYVEGEVEARLRGETRTFERRRGRGGRSPGGWP